MVTVASFSAELQSLLLSEIVFKHVEELRNIPSGGRSQALTVINKF